MPDYSEFQSRVEVRPDDIDMNQHVHNSKYFDYVLTARYDQMERCYGMSMEAFLDRGFSWVVRASYMEHKRPLRIGDAAIVKTKVEEIKTRGVKVAFEIHKESDRKLVAKGWLDYTMVALDSGRPRPVPDDIIEIYSV
ncbi:MAG: thioesterase family protein [Verrucomicrobiales bacterium]|nr:thioesterase family protein [Verrucomicrobiales bacterium]